MVRELVVPTARPLSKAAPAVAATTLVILVALTFVNPWVFVADDSLFYLVVADRIVAGDGWTFNGLIPTNGVQPLWQLLVVPVTAIGDLVGLEAPADRLRAVLVLNWALALGALAMAWRLLGRTGVAEPFRLLGVVVLGCCLCGPWGMFASEGHLVAVLVLGVLLCVERWVRAGPSPSVVVSLGVVTGLLMLARLDAVWVAGAALAAVVLLPDGPGAARLRWAGLAGLVATAVVVPYLWWNLTEFGHLTPISGAIKVDLTAPRFGADGVGPYGWALLAAIWGGGAFAVLRSPRHTARLAVWSVPAVGATVSSLFYFAFSRGPFTQWFWYFVPHAVALTLTVAFATDRAASELPRRSGQLRALARVGSAGLAVLAVVFCTARYVTGPPDQLWSGARAAAEQLADAVPPDEAIAVVDLPGVLGFVSGRPIVALDGLVGDFEFQDRWRDDGGACTLASVGVEHLVTVRDYAISARDGDSVTLDYSSWLHREVPSSTLRGADPRPVSADGRYVLWRFENTCPSSS